MLWDYSFSTYAKFFEKLTFTYSMLTKYDRGYS